MTYGIEWTKEAEFTYNRILNEIEEKWTEREVENFIARTEQVIGFIFQNPGMYPYSQKGRVHRAVISKQTSLYYHTSEEKIILLSFEDNRQHPIKRKY